jgi:hypothetical protein
MRFVNLTRWRKLLVQARVEARVTLAQMHHFIPLWEGHDLWRETSNNVEIHK